MAKCQKCDEPIPTRIAVGDREIQYSRKRLYCFDCKPRKCNPIEPNPDTTCESCDRQYKYDKSRGHRKTICNSCAANRKRHTRKQKAIKYKGGICMLCGYDRCEQALSFHHINPTTKLFAISGSHARAWETVMKELDKCLLVCANLSCRSRERS